MPRSNRKGVISFGLVTIPIVLYPSKNKMATISFHQIDKRDNARIRYERINTETGKSVPWEDITKGYAFDKETVIPVPDDVLKNIAGDKSHAINIEHFIEKKDLNLLTLENVYYIVPDKNGEKGYVILRDALEETGKAGIAKVIISTKEYLAAVFPQDNALMLCLLHYDDEIRKPSEFDLPLKDHAKYKVSAKEIDVAKQLIKSMTAKWHPEKYVDEYQQSIHQWVDESVHNLPHTQKTKGKTAKKAKPVVNFVDLLKKSLAASGNKKSKKKAPVKTHTLRKHKGKAAHHRTLH